MSERGERDVLARYDDRVEMGADGDEYGEIAHDLAAALRAERDRIAVARDLLRREQIKVAALRSKLDAGVRGWVTDYGPGWTLQLRTTRPSMDACACLLIFTDDERNEI